MRFTPDTGQINCQKLLGEIEVLGYCDCPLSGVDSVDLRPRSALTPLGSWSSRPAGAGSALLEGFRVPGIVRFQGSGVVPRLHRASLGGAIRNEAMHLIHQY